jgi:hypothetical protein
MLFEIAPTDPIIFCALATLLAGVAVLACLALALRATLFVERTRDWGAVSAAFRLASAER